MEWSLRSPDHQCGFAFRAEPAREPYYLAHRPRVLADLVGNLHIVDALRAFVADPYPRAFLFAGDTGTGKSTAALALAHDLGCSEYSGLQVIDSACQDVDTVRSAIDRTRYTPFPSPGSRGWHCIVVEECDLGSKPAKALWLSALDRLNARTVVCFTSNNPDSLEQRFRDRCMRFEFPSELALTIDAAQLLADRIYLEETGRDDGPDIATLPHVCVNGRISFRRVCDALETLIRYGSEVTLCA